MRSVTALMEPMEASQTCLAKSIASFLWRYSTHQSSSAVTPMILPELLEAWWWRQEACQHLTCSHLCLSTRWQWQPLCITVTSAPPHQSYSPLQDFPLIDGSQGKELFVTNKLLYNNPSHIQVMLLYQTSASGFHPPYGNLCAMRNGSPMVSNVCSTSLLPPRSRGVLLRNLRRENATFKGCKPDAHAGGNWGTGSWPSKIARNGVCTWSGDFEYGHLGARLDCHRHRLPGQIRDCHGARQLFYCQELWVSFQCIAAQPDELICALLKHHIISKPDEPKQPLQSGSP